MTGTARHSASASALQGEPLVEAAAIGLSAVSDHELMARARDGSMPCFVEIVSRYEGRLVNFLVRRVGRGGDAEDLTQETFLRAWKSIARFRPQFAVSTWLFTIASRLATDHLRRKRHETGGGRDWSQAEDTRVDVEEAKEVSRGRGQDLWATAQRLLTAEQYSALWLRYAEDLSIQQVARVLGRTAIGVRVMLFRARRSLADHAGDAGERARANRSAGRTGIEKDDEQDGSDAPVVTVTTKARRVECVAGGR